VAVGYTGPVAFTKENQQVQHIRWKFERGMASWSFFALACLTWKLPTSSLSGSGASLLVSCPGHKTLWPLRPPWSKHVILVMDRIKFLADWNMQAACMSSVLWNSNSFGGADALEIAVTVF
jgi:hypothetical protein